MICPGCQRRRRPNPRSLSLSSDSVSLKGKGKCQSERLAASSAGGLTPWLCGRLVGWVRERAYLRTVLREMPRWRAISRRESPWTLAVRAGSGASIATMRLATSAISKAHEWSKLESPYRDPGVRASLKGWGRRLSKPQRQVAALQAPPSPGSLRNGIKPSSGDAILSLDREGLSEPREPAPNPLTMVAAANGRGSVIDDEDVISMTVTASPRRPTFLQQARWNAVQKAKLESMSIRKMASELGLHRDTVRRYIDAESPPTRQSPATLPASTSDTIPHRHVTFC